MRDLIVLQDDNGAFIDYTNDSIDYLRDSYTIDFTNSEDFIYIGLYKPFNKIYIDFKNPAIASNNLSFQYYNGSSYVDLEAIDDTKGFTRAGFISFEKPENWQNDTIDSKNKYYIRMDADTFTAEIQGLNIVFADDNDLRQDVRCIDDYLQGNDINFIAYHVNARNEIVQTLRNGGHSTKIKGVDNVENLTKWDLLDIGEIRQAAKYLTLSKIFYDVSENTDDKQYQRAVDYNDKFGEAFKLYRISIDKNDDGKADKDEKTQLRGMRIHKR